MIFSALTFAVAIPSAIKVFNWLATMYKGSIWLATPMCYALVFLFLFAIGGLTGTLPRHPLGQRRRARHLLRRGPFPLRHGGRHDGRLPGRAALLVAEDDRPDVQRILGADRRPAGVRRLQPHVLSAVHPRHPGTAAALLRATRECCPTIPSSPAYNVYSSLGAYLLAAGLVLVAVYLAHSLFRGRRAPANPWGAATLEWQCSSPPPYDNFATPPAVGDPYSFAGLVYDPVEGGYVRTSAPDL